MKYPKRQKTTKNNLFLNFPYAMTLIEAEVTIVEKSMQQEDLKRLKQLT